MAGQNNTDILSRAKEVMGQRPEENALESEQLASTPEEVAIIPEVEKPSSDPLNREAVESGDQELAAAVSNKIENFLPKQDVPQQAETPVVAPLVPELSSDGEVISLPVSMSKNEFKVAERAPVQSGARWLAEQLKRLFKRRAQQEPDKKIKFAFTGENQEESRVAA